MRFKLPKYTQHAMDITLLDSMESQVLRASESFHDTVIIIRGHLNSAFGKVVIITASIYHTRTHRM